MRTAQSGDRSATGANAAEAPPQITDEDPRDADTPTPAGRASKWLLVALVVGYVVHVAWRIWLSRNLNAPAAHADEDGYLVAARAIAGGPGGVTTENEAFRRLGYPMLLSPIYWFTSDAFTVYRSTLVFNALVNALVFPLAYLFGRRVVGLSWRTALAAGFVLALMPGVMFYSQFALTDVVLAPTVTAWLLAVYYWVDGASTRARVLGAVGAGAAAGLFFAVHVRGLIILAVHVALIVGLLLLRRTSLRLGFVSLCAAGFAAASDPAMKLLIRGEIIASGRSPKSQTIDAITTLGGFGRMLAGADGQIWYLCVATLGLGAVGVIWTVLPLRHPTKLRENLTAPVTGVRWLVAVTALATTLLIAVGSAAALPPLDNRFNYFAYPRYIHMLFPVWALFGIAALLAVKTRRQLMVLGVSALGLTGLTGLVVYARARAADRALFQPFDAPELLMLGWRWDAFGVTRPTAVAVVLFTVIALALYRWKWRALAAVLVAFGALQTVNMALVTERVSEKMVTFQYTASTPRLVRDGYVEPGEKIAFAMRNQPSWYLRFNHMREVYWDRITYFDQTTTNAPANADVVIAPWRPGETEYHWTGEQFGFRLVVVDEAQQWALWRRT